MLCIVRVSVDPTNLHCFEFDHTSPELKKKAISDIATASNAIFHADLKGCRLLCIDPCLRGTTRALIRLAAASLLEHNLLV